MENKFMIQQKLLDELEELPLEAQNQVIDFIESIKARYKKAEIETTSLSEEVFFGLWKNREDMQDSTAWVRNLRKKQWTRHLDE